MKTDHEVKNKETDPEPVKPDFDSKLSKTDVNNPVLKQLPSTSSVIPIPLIPGLSEKERLKALKGKEKKNKKKSPSKEDSAKDLEKDFVFQDTDAGEVQIKFEDTKEELDDTNEFISPIVLKSKFAQQIRSESASKSRSRSTSIKRLQTSPETEKDPNKKKQRSGLPVPGSVK